MQRLHLFLRARGGGSAALFAAILGMLTLALGGALDLSNMMRIQRRAQTAADQAALAAAYAYANGADHSVSVSQGLSYLKSALELGGFSPQSPSLIVGRADNGAVTAQMSFDLLVDTTLLKLANLEASTLNLEAAATVDYGVDLYVILMLDATGSMGGVIEAVKTAASDLGRTLRDGLAARGFGANRIFVKVAYFRDLRITDTPPAGQASVAGWAESDIYNMGDDAQVAALEAFVQDQSAFGGGDAPESSLAAISEALTAERPAVFANQNVLQTIVVWSDTGALPLSDADANSSEFTSWHSGALAYDDITVALWRAFGPIDAGGYSEESYETTIIDEIYGCCVDLNQLEGVWLTGGIEPLKRRRLGLYVNTAAYPWPILSQWENVLVNDYTAPDADQIAAEIVEVVLGSQTDLRLNN